MKKLQQGFTLVELLVVIVVIAILASITIVAYNGIQDRAKNAAMLSAFDATEKLLRIYKAENGDYPNPTDQPNAIACVSGQLPSENGFALNQCSIGPSPAYSRSTVLDNALKTITSQLPDTHSYSGKTGLGTFRGLIYQYVSGGGAAYLMYVVNGDQSCGRGEALPNGTGGTVCQLVLD